MAERASDQFKEADWHASAVSRACQILEQAINLQSSGQQVSPEPLVDALVAANLVPLPDGTLKDADRQQSNLVLGALIGEAAALLLHRRTERVAWRSVRSLLSQFNGMFMPFRMSIQSLFHNDERFRELFNKLADEIVADEIAHPASEIYERERDNFHSLLDQWHIAPELRSVWFGLPQMRHSFYFSEMDILANIYLTVDPRYLAQLLDRFDNPYQIWAALTGFGGLGLDRSFAAWSRLFTHALPGFEIHGSWTGRTLEPLLLVIAQDALRQARLPQSATEEVISNRQNELDVLTAAIAKIIAEKSQGSSLALRWGAWLFRMSAGGTNADQEPYPQDLRQGATPFWRMLEALARSDAAKSWNGISVPDAAAEEVLCLLAAKILAASEQHSALPDAEPLFRCIPDAPEDFVGERSKATRNLTRLFSSYNARPDALKFRILSLLFFQGDPVSRYRDFWKRTLTLRELAEHWQAGDPNEGRDDAKQVIGMVLAIGLTSLDYYADARSANDPISARNSQQFGELFRLVYDGLRELQAIELFNQEFWSRLYTHLLVRRALYENAAVRDMVIASPLPHDMEPTLSTMLANIAGVTQPFFEGLDSLLRNGVPMERVTTALRRAESISQCWSMLPPGSMTLTSDIRIELRPQFKS
jgi:hypothetical protein